MEQMRTLDFTDKSVLVTGASSGIGFAVAKAFAQSGANVSILAENPGIFEAASEIEEVAGRLVAPILCNISNRDEVSSSISKLSQIDVLVNNAGVEKVTPIDEKGHQTDDDFQTVMDVNLMGSYFVTRQALCHMPDGAKIVFTASTWSKSAYAKMGAYCASKHAVLGLARTLAHELGSRRINVNCICPGWVRTDQSIRSLVDISERDGIPLDRITDDLLAKQAIGGLLEPEDLVNGYLFLASDLARDITGQALHVDRGELMF